jgi:hypothetical protein
MHLHCGEHPITESITSPSPGGVGSEEGIRNFEICLERRTDLVNRSMSLVQYTSSYLCI